MPAAEGQPLSYALKLKNRGDAPVRDFRLCFCGPARIEPTAQMEGGTLESRVSNHSGAGRRRLVTCWSRARRGRSPVRGSQLSAAALERWREQRLCRCSRDGAVVPVITQPTAGCRGTMPRAVKARAIFPVPAKTPVNLSIIPWPKSVRTERGPAGAGRARRRCEQRGEARRRRLLSPNWRTACFRPRG